MCFSQAKRMPLVEAYKFVKHRRRFIGPNWGMGSAVFILLNLLFVFLVCFEATLRYSTLLYFGEGNVRRGITDLTIARRISQAAMAVRESALPLTEPSPVAWRVIPNADAWHIRRRAACAHSAGSREAQL